MTQPAHDNVTRLLLDDFTVGQKFATASRTITADEIKAFARDFDPQPFHLDEELARGSFFGELVASGWHTAALSMRLIVEGELRIAGGVVGGGGEIAWKAPVRPGDTLHCVSEVLAVDASTRHPDRGTVTVRSETLNQDGTVVQVTVVKLLAFRRGSKYVAMPER